MENAWQMHNNGPFAKINPREYLNSRFGKYILEQCQNNQVILTKSSLNNPYFY